MTTIITILILVAIAATTYILYLGFANSEFRKTCKEGDKCYYMDIDDDGFNITVEGTITKVTGYGDNKWVEILNEDNSISFISTDYIYKLKT